MKLTICKKSLSRQEHCDLRHNSSVVATIYDALTHETYNPARVARLFQSAEELQGLVEYVMGFCGFQTNEMFSKAGDFYSRAESLVNYIKTGEEKEEMVILKMSRKSAEKANFLKFEVIGE